ncbi:fasciclin-like arabinogalactan protein 1 [Impatiens glandulifera]|uniref:fasciclin-like arabinogalactan protein 1 n=1 Tax=Impatiens glandulifera TaxID=253017 RepID=UPI001FB0E713|nr:fasciclin-like arabinogalactan protein 1 [Impatiens glandulifera]
MQQLRLSFAGAGASVLSIIFFLAFVSTTEAHNITRILAKFPDFSAFNHYLTLTHLAAEINSRRTITVLAVSNEGMEDLLSKHLQISFIKNVLSFHVLLDYFDARKLHQITGGTALAATVFQASGNAPGSSGFVKITDLRRGRVGFGAQDTGGIIDAVFIKSLEEIAFNISVIQISKILPLTTAEVPSPPPSPINITSLMSAHGCKEFAETLLSSAAEKAYEDNLDGGVTIFCPGDDVFNKFIPIYKNLSADEQQSLLEYHGIPLYESLSTLRSTNGVMNTLATDGVDKYGIVVQNDGEDVTLKTNVVTARITGTIIEKQSSVGIFMIDKVLLPMEIFNATTTISSPAPSPGPDDDVEKPKSPPPKGKRPKHLSPPAPDSDSDSPALSPDDDAADQTDDTNSGAAGNGLSAGVPLCMLWVFLLL